MTCQVPIFPSASRPHHIGCTPEQEEITIIVLSPADLAPFGERGDSWAFAPLYWPAQASFVAPPPPEAIVQTADPQEADPLLADRPVLLFDYTTLVRLNVWRSRAMLSIIPTARLRSLRAYALAANERDMPSLFALGQESSARLDLSEIADLPAAQAAVFWTTNLLCLLLAIKEQQRLFA